MDIARDKLDELIMHIRAYDARSGDADIDDDNDVVEEDDYDEDGEDHHIDDIAHDELAALINSLNEDEQATLVALVWLGRGDHQNTDWADIVKQAKDRAEGPTADYLLGIPLLADLLAEGLNARTQDETE